MNRRIEGALETALARATERAPLSAAPLPTTPPTLSKAMHYAVFPGGGRVRAQLCLAVAGACGDDLPAVSDAAAASIEFLHCASLVHDDLPCFDDADVRRGKPSVHRAFGEAMAVLVGDGLIVAAFETLAYAGRAAPARALAMTAILARAVGAAEGLVAGQAFESEPTVPLGTYHRAKTGALFRGAAMAGAMSAGADPLPWAAMGDALGVAYQLADDLYDVLTPPSDGDKPTQRDAALAHPNAARVLGVDGARHAFERALDSACHAIPGDACTDDAQRERLSALVRELGARLVPPRASVTRSSAA